MEKIRRFTPKQLVVAGVFTVALAGVVAGGVAIKQHTQAASMPRECDSNAILRCGAITPSEFIGDVRSDNGGTQKDLKTIYADSRVGDLGGEDYDRFKSTARMGKVYKNGDVIVDGQKVMTGANSLGREKFNSHRQPITIGGKTYYYSSTNASFAADSIDAMVMFDGDGTVETVILTSCGNPVWGTKVKSGATCEDLQQHKVSGKENTYKFTTNVSKYGHAKITKVEYFIDGKLWRTETDPAKATPEYTFTKTSTVTVKVTIELPGKKTKVIESAKCKRVIEVKVKEIFYTCKNLVATARDNTNRNFRFTAKTNQSEGVTVTSADFTLDSKTTTTGVTTKDGNGDIYKDYDFTDNVEHTISAKVNFTHEGKTYTSKETCVAKVTPEKPPVCEFNPNLPPNHPDCNPPAEECKPGIPVGDARCEDVPQELPKTGPASLVGLFAGTSIAGSAAHRLFLRYRGRE